jgi:hypothetical protein
MESQTEARGLGILAIALALFGAFAQYRWHDMPPAVTNGALLLAALLGAWAIWVLLPKRAFPKRVFRVNTYLIVAGIFAACSIGAVVGYWIDWHRGPIQWDLAFPLDLSKPTNGPWTVGGFQISGVNNSDDPVRVKDAYIRSDITSRIVPLVVGVLGGEINASNAVIKPQAEVRFWGKYPADNSGRVPLETALQEFGRFTFVFEYEDGRTYQRHFNQNDIDVMMARLDEASRNADKGPGVVRKQ